MVCHEPREAIHHAEALHYPATLKQQCEAIKLGHVLVNHECLDVLRRLRGERGTWVSGTATYALITGRAYRTVLFEEIGFTERGILSELRVLVRPEHGRCGRARAHNTGGTCTLGFFNAQGWLWLWLYSRP